jgi:hypothetical protein
MHLSHFLTAALLPLGLLANPTAHEEAEIDARAIKRPQTCGIVGNSATVKCREGPGTKWDVRTTLRRGTEHDFWCVLSKECITIGGSTNWYVQTMLLNAYLETMLTGEVDGITSRR